MNKLLLSLLTILPLSSGCAHVSTVPDSEFCRLVEPISYDSVKDTPETVAQVERLNAKWLVLCDRLQ
jgi:hypothetical protein